MRSFAGRGFVIDPAAGERGSCQQREETGIAPAPVTSQLYTDMASGGHGVAVSGLTVYRCIDALR